MEVRKCMRLRRTWLVRCTCVDFDPDIEKSAFVVRETCVFIDGYRGHVLWIRLHWTYTGQEHGEEPDIRHVTFGDPGDRSGCARSVQWTYYHTGQ